MSIGKLLRKARKAKGLTQERLAELIGSSQTCISDLENDHRLMQDEMLAKLSNVLDTSLATPVRPMAYVPGRKVLQPLRPRCGMRPGEISFDVRMNQARLTLGRQVVDDLLNQLRQREEAQWWLCVLRRWPFDSGLEAILAVRMLLEGAFLTRIRLSQAGFPWPVVDPQTKRCTGHYTRWGLALVRGDIRVVLVPCVTLQLQPVTSRTGRRRLDLALVAQIGKVRCCGNVEMDGKAHLTTQGQLDDRAREEEIDLPTLRISETALKQSGVLATLLDFAARLPGDARSAAGSTGRWR
ncbi:MAG TPA: helix-turn-helix domain-containing protein [Candidatus Xenobia bacterium]|jgi:transcriptional regulator with XRE-family HTH domain